MTRNPLTSLRPPNVLGVHALSAFHGDMRRALVLRHHDANEPQGRRLARLEMERVDERVGRARAIDGSPLSMLTHDHLNLVLSFLSGRDVGRARGVCAMLRELDLASRPLCDDEFFEFARGFELLVAAAGFVNRGPLHQFLLDPAVKRTKHAVVRAFQNAFFKCSIVGRPRFLNDQATPDGGDDERHEEHSYTIVPRSDAAARIVIETNQNELRLFLIHDADDGEDHESPAHFDNETPCVGVSTQNITLGVLCPEVEAIDRGGGDDDGPLYKFAAGRVWVRHPASVHELAAW